MNNNDIPVWEKYTLTIEEASKYFRIGENNVGTYPQRYNSYCREYGKYHHNLCQS